MSINWAVTTHGIGLISTAIATGPYVQLPTFRVGSGFGYTPNSGDTAIHGTLLHTGSVSSVTTINNDTIHVIVTLDQSVGDFSFGEIGLYSTDGFLFALGTLPTLQNKRATVTGVQVGDVIKLDIYIVQTGVGAAVNVVLTSVTNAQLVTIPSVDSLIPPIVSGSNAYLTSDLDYAGAQILAMADTDYFWTFPGFRRMFSGTSTSVGTTTTLECSALTANDVNDVSAGRYIVEITSGTYAGYCRNVTAKAGSTITWATPFPANVANGVTFTVWEAWVGSSLQKTGGTMKAAITLPGNAVNPLEAIPLQQAQGLLSTFVTSTQGTFTPLLYIDNVEISTAGGSYFYQDGRWFNIGKFYFYSLLIILSNKGSSVGIAKIKLDTLPVADGNYPGTVSIDLWSAITEHPSAMVEATTNFVQLRLFDGAGSDATQVSSASLQNNSVTYVTGLFMTP